MDKDKKEVTDSDEGFELNILNRALSHEEIIDRYRKWKRLEGEEER